MSMFIAVVPNRKSRPMILLSETNHEDGKVRNRTLVNQRWPTKDSPCALTMASYLDQGSIEFWLKTMT